MLPERWAVNTYCKKHVNDNSLSMSQSNLLLSLRSLVYKTISPGPALLLALHNQRTTTLIPLWFLYCSFAGL